MNNNNKKKKKKKKRRRRRITTIIYIALFSYSFIALYNDQINIELKN